MNNELMQILEIINAGLRGTERNHDTESPADMLCEIVLHNDIKSCGARSGYECSSCPIGYKDNNNHATQIIQTWRQL